MKTETAHTGHTNPDAITGSPGSHPGATGIGAASGAATGAAIGAIGGPVGAVIGGVVGAAVGGVTGHSIGEWNDPSDATYWQNEYKNRSYFDKTANYDSDVVPALSYGSRLRRNRTAANSSFASVEDKVKNEWDRVRGQSKYSYEQARPLISDAYERED
jgi:phage tail tape-measure protein